MYTILLKFACLVHKTSQQPACRFFVSRRCPLYQVINQPALVICFYQVSMYSKGPFTLDPRTKFNAHWMRICRIYTWIRFGRCAFDAHRVSPLLEVDWNRIRTEFIVYSSNNDKITHGYAPMNSNIVEAFASRPPYTLYSSSKIRTTMAYHAGTPLTRCCRKRDRLPSGLM